MRYVIALLFVVTAAHADPLSRASYALELEKHMLRSGIDATMLFGFPHTSPTG
jgi:hypothetical protein